jgi:uncharacterized membrane protein (UPF0127 family)
VARLLCDGVAVAAVEVAADRRSRARGLLGRDGIEGALLLPGVRGVHTLGMRFAIDVGFVDRTGRVVDTVTMPPWRVGRTRWSARDVLEAAAGSFQRWGLVVGSTVAADPS